ncbi:MAG: transglycosylase domain-containing protein, partial [Lachnospiraceae bacterium]|nr:transglycosylase domain-containing protein [Lachnospiraceae bacterium]
RRGIKKQQLALNAKGPKWARKLLLLLAVAACVCIIGVGIVGAAVGIGAFNGLLSTAPDLSQSDIGPTGLSSFIYDSEGNQMYKLISENANRIQVKSEDICQDLKDAFVAIEDERFYTHNGIDIKRILGLGYKALLDGGFSGGGSTITQQLLKNNIFTDWMSESNFAESMKRKILEQYCAIQVEKMYDKDTILTYYLNTINLGSGTLGVESASLRYFNKHASELSLSECAVIAGITKYPGKYNPILHPDENRKRMETVLWKMNELGYISDAEYEAALADNVYERIQETNAIVLEADKPATYFEDAVIRQVQKDLIKAGYTQQQAYTLMYSRGIKIYSTMDPEIQQICDEEFSNPDNYAPATEYLLDWALTIEKADGTYENHSKEMLKKFVKQSRANFNLLYKDPEGYIDDVEAYKASVMAEGDSVLAERAEITPQPQISFAMIEQSTGKCVAMIGGRGEKTKNLSLNRATEAKRQPGSCFKVLASFGPAIDHNSKSLATVYVDAPFAYKDGTKVNNWYGDEYRGIQTIRAGIYNSLNIIAVKCITEITPEIGFEYLENMGFTTLVRAEKRSDGMIYTDINQPLALGGITDGIINYELTAAYAGIANGGTYIEPKLYTTVTDNEGNIILDNREPVTRQIFTPETSYQLIQAMIDCAKFGSGRQISFPGMTTAGKTGTTSNEQDIWIAAFTPYYTASCWTGYDNNEKLTVAQEAIPKEMWRKVMQRVTEVKELENKEFERPAGIKECDICALSGKLPRPGICDGHIKREIFTEESIPTEYCDVHYQGRVCGYDNLPATDQCPFCYEGILTMNPPEAASIQQGSALIAAELDPLSTGTATQAATGHCHHDESFFVQPGWEWILEQERAQYAERVAAVQAAQAAQDNPEAQGGEQ